MSIDQKSRETRRRLEKCWAQELNWDLFPEFLIEVCMTNFCTAFISVFFVVVVIFAITYMQRTLVTISLQLAINITCYF